MSSETQVAEIGALLAVMRGDTDEAYRILGGMNYAELYMLRIAAANLHDGADAELRKGWR